MSLTKIPGNLIKDSTITAANVVGGSLGGGPKITQIQVTDPGYTVLDDTAVDVSGGYIRITGTGFASGCQVLINKTSATSTTFVSATEVRAQVPAMSAGTYTVYLVNSDGGVAIRVNGLTYSAAPAWSTSSTLPTQTANTQFSINLEATGAVSYALASGSTLPAGLSLSSNGQLSGSVATNVDTNYNFTVIATDAESQESSRAFTLSIITSYQIELLMVAGGGGGGAGTSGGGGAGGLLYYGAETPKTPNGSALTVVPGTSYSIAVGGGGADGGLGGPAAGNGGNTTFSGGSHNLTAIGGGGAGHVYSSGAYSTAGKSGGSGGGGAIYSGYTAALGTGTSGQGNNGGTYGTDTASGGGGGGAGQAGVAALSGGTGGNGLEYAISGAATYYAGGGGGGVNAAIRSGGLGGGGSSGTSGNAGNGTANTGGGGGGGYDYATGAGGAGGSGVLILRYLGSQRGTGGTITSSGGYTIHKFTGDGTFVA